MWGIRTIIVTSLTLAVGVSQVIPYAPNVEDFPLTLQSDGSYVGTQRGALAPGAFAIWRIPGASCHNNSLLLIEAWTITARHAITGQAMPRAPSAILYTSKGASVGSPFSSQTSPGYAGNYTYKDIVRPYMKDERYFGPNSNSSEDAWNIIVLNDNATIGYRAITYALRATCSQTPQCLSPIWNNSRPAGQEAIPCAGYGNCTVVAPTSPTGAVCICDDNHGGTGCYYNVTLIQPGTTIRANNLPGSVYYWKFWTKQNTSNVLVELTRLSGALLLYLKSTDEGPEPDEVPLYHQLNGYADLDAYKGRSDFSSLARYNTTAQQFYIGVWNVQEDVVAPGSFNLTAYATPADQNLCPFNCSGHGTCLANGTCRCSPGWLGDQCQGQQLPELNDNLPQSANLAPGSWVYTFYNVTNPSNDLLVQFNFTGKGELSGDSKQVILLANWGSPPTVSRNNFIFRPQAGQVLRQTLTSGLLRRAPLYFGVYNMDYYISSGFSFRLYAGRDTTSQSRGTNMRTLGVNLWLGVTAGVIGLVFILMGLFAIARCYRPQWMPAFMQPPSYRSSVAAENGSSEGRVPVHPRPSRARRRTDQRMHPSEMRNVTTSIFINENTGDGHDGSCPTCLESFQPGESIHTLPCKHAFHAKYACLEQWLVEHCNACPICRTKVGMTRAEFAHECRKSETELVERAQQSTSDGQSLSSASLPRAWSYEARYTHRSHPANDFQAPDQTDSSTGTGGRAETS